MSDVKKLLDLIFGDAMELLKDLEKCDGSCEKLFSRQK